MSKIIDFEHWRRRLVRKRMKPRDWLLYRDILSGNPVMIYDIEVGAVLYAQHAQQPFDHKAMVHWLGMPTS